MAKSLHESFFNEFSQFTKENAEKYADEHEIKLLYPNHGEHSLTIGQQLYYCPLNINKRLAMAKYKITKIECIYHICKLQNQIWFIIEVEEEKTNPDLSVQTKNYHTWAICHLSDILYTYPINYYEIIQKFKSNPNYYIEPNETTMVSIHDATAIQTFNQQGWIQMEIISYFYIHSIILCSNGNIVFAVHQQKTTKNTQENSIRTSQERYKVFTSNILFQTLGLSNTENITSFIMPPYY
jgi:hypothetical protein